MPHGLGELACPSLGRAFASPSQSRLPSPGGQGASPQPALPEGQGPPATLLSSLPCPQGQEPPASPCRGSLQMIPPARWGCHQYLQICLYLLAPTLPADLYYSGVGSLVGGLHVQREGSLGLPSVYHPYGAGRCCLPVSGSHDCPPHQLLRAGNQRAVFYLHEVICLLPCDRRLGCSCHRFKVQ